MLNKTLPSLKNTVSVSVTAPEKPSSARKKLSELLENNKISVKCKFPEKFRGPKKEIHAYLYKSGKLESNKSTEKRDCHFEFPNLSYLTSYQVEVCVATITNKNFISFTIS